MVGVKKVGERKRKKIISLGCLVIALVCLWTSCAVGDSILTMPSGLTEIEADAFAGDLSIDEVILNEGITSVGDRAFQSSGISRVYLPESLTHIGKDAFPAGTVGYGASPTYASAYFEEAKDLIFEKAVYNIADIVYAEGVFTATVTTTEECVLHVQLFDENSGTELLNLRANADAALTDAELTVSAPEGSQIPAFFGLTSWLEDTDGNSLCGSCTTMRYTEAYAQLEKKEAGDYPSSRVQNYNDGGFAVLSEGVKAVTGSRNENGQYRLEGQPVLQSGDCLMISIGNSSYPVKAANVIYQDDGSTIVIPDSNVYLSDFYDVIRVDKQVQLNGGSPQSLVSRSADESDTISAKIDAEFGPVKVEGSASIAYHFSMIYDKEYFGDSYYELKSSLEANFSLTATVTAAMSTKDLKNPPKITIYKGTISGIPWLAEVNAEVSLPLDMELKGEGKFTLEIKTEIGFSYNSHDGRKEINSKDIDPGVEILGEFTIKTGPKVTVKASMGGELLTASFSGQVGFEIKGTLTTDNIMKAGEKKIHGCDICIDGKVSAFIKIGAALKWKLSEKCKGNLADLTLVSVKIQLFDCYLSLKNDEHSLFRGKMTFGKGKCPNYAYRVTVITQNEDGEELKGLPVSVISQSGSRTEGESPMDTFLYPGEHIARADYGNEYTQISFPVANQPRTITLNTPYRVTGRVTRDEDGEPLSAANVSVQDKHTGNSFLNVETDEDGYFVLYLPEGEYLVSAYYPGYEEEETFLTVNRNESTTIGFRLQAAQNFLQPFACSNAAIQTDAVSMSSASYTNAVLFTMGYTGLANGGTSIATYNLDGNYSSFSFMAGYVRGAARNAKMSVFADGQVIYNEVEMKPEDIAKRYTVSTGGVKRLVIQFTSSGYDKTIYAIAEIQASGFLSGKIYKSDYEFNDTQYFLQRGEVLDGRFTMGGRKYIRGYKFKTGYNGTSSGPKGVVSFNVNQKYQSMTFDIARIQNRASEPYTRSALLTIELDGVPMSGYEDVEILWNDLPKTVQVNVSGASQVTIRVTSDGYDTIYWGIGNIHFTEYAAAGGGGGGAW